MLLSVEAKARVRDLCRQVGDAQTSDSEHELMEELAEALGANSSYETIGTPTTRPHITVRIDLDGQQIARVLADAGRAAQL